uniref:Uncharacterized protein n=1 Tax=Brassica oleracea TaxID=3712 RepID=A0A3P6A8Q8_BRAOL|nr:unnamed protein product [Brassica oleracea]
MCFGLKKKIQSLLQYYFSHIKIVQHSIIEAQEIFD